MARFFRYPRNYIGQRSYSTASPPVFLPEVQDNDYTTETDVLTIDVYIDTVGDGTGDTTAFTAVFIKCVDVASYTVALTDGNIADYSVTITDTLSNGTSIIDRDGNQNHLWLYDQTQTPSKAEAKVLRFTFTGKMGGTPTVNEIMILEELFAIDEPTVDFNKRFRNIRITPVRRGATSQYNPKGELSIAPALGNPRVKHRVEYTARFKTKPILEEFLHFWENHPQCAFAPNYNLYPRFVFPAVLSRLDASINYIFNWENAPQDLPIVVEEK